MRDTRSLLLGGEQLQLEEEQQQHCWHCWNPLPSLPHPWVERPHLQLRPQGPPSSRFHQQLTVQAELPQEAGHAAAELEEDKHRADRSKDEKAAADNQGEEGRDRTLGRQEADSHREGSRGGRAEVAAAEDEASAASCAGRLRGDEKAAGWA
jgi:hypothetical protein